MRATIFQWGVITGIKVIDPDGFNRKDPHLMERLFTYNEFSRGVMNSTCQMPKYDDSVPVGILPAIEKGERE